MTGPEHYETAERTVALARECMRETPGDMAYIDQLLQLAGVHAQLAQVAATIDAAARDSQYARWAKVLT